MGTNHQVPLLADDSEGPGSGVCVHQRRRGGLSHEIEDQAICIDGDIGKVIEDVRK